MDEALIAWIAAIESGFAGPEEWAAWADWQILRSENLPQWVLDLSLAQAARDALAALRPATDKLPPAICERVDWTGLYLGFLYLRFQRGDFPMLELLVRAGDRAGGYSFRVDCSTFYLLVNEIDGGGPTVPRDRALADRVGELFEPLAGPARQFWSRLSGETA
jgi:hypothetical protein